MTSRRDLLQGCLLAGIHLALPASAAAAAPPSTVRWTATWSVDTEGDARIVRVTVSPDRDTTLLVDDSATGAPGSRSPQALQVQPDGDAEALAPIQDAVLQSRLAPRWRERALSRGATHTFGPWRIEAPTDRALSLALPITYGADQTTTLRHYTGKPRFEARWEVLPAGRSTVSVRVALTASHDTSVHLMGGMPPGFRVLSGGDRVQPPGTMSRAGPRRGRTELTAGVATKVGGWLVRPTEGPLRVALDLEHDGGQTHLEAELSLDAGGA